MVCGNFILPEPASYVFFYAFSNLRNLLYIILSRGNEIISVAKLVLTPYNKSCIDKWLSTRPVLDAGLLSGIGAERSVE